MRLQDHVTAIAAAAAGPVGIDPFTILTIVSTLLPMLVQWFNGCNQATPQTAKQVLADHFDETTATFDSAIIDQARPHTRRAARQQGQRRLSRHQLDAITVATFQHALAQDESTLASAVVEAAQQPTPTSSGDDEP